MGDAGEFAASVLLTAAYDRALASALSPGVEHVLPGVPVPVSAFLEEILGSDASRQVAECGLVEDRFFCLFQMPVAYEDVSRAWLFDALHRRVAIICRKGTHGVDLIVPMAKGDKGAKTMEELAISDSGAILIQPKNWAQSSFDPSKITRIFVRIGAFARETFPSRIEYVSALALIRKRSLEEGGKNEVTKEGRSKGPTKEDTKLWLVLATINLQVLASAKTGHDLQAIAKGTPRPEETAAKIEKSHRPGFNRAMHTSVTAPFCPLSRSALLAYCVHFALACDEAPLEREQA